MYSNRIVCFLDILGFGQLIAKSANSIALQKEVFNFLSTFTPDKLIEEIHHGAAGYPDISNPVFHEASLLAELKGIWKFQATHFSDSIVISADSSMDMGWCHIIDMIARFQVRLFRNFKLLVRGGVASGQLVHDDSGLLFGPALNRAYKLESEQAIYPRVLIDENLYETIKNDKYCYMADPLIDEGDDGLFHINLATSFRYLLSGVSDPVFGSRDYSQLNQHFIDSRKYIFNIDCSNFPERVQHKYRWLSTQMKYHGSFISNS